LGRHPQALPPPEPLDALGVDVPALRPQKGRDAAVAVPAVLAGQLGHPRHQARLVVGHGRRAPLGGARLAQDPAGPALRDAPRAAHLADVLDHRAPLRRAQYFPEAASLRMALSSSASARSRLSRAFSRSRSLRRLAWSVFSPPYSLRQR